MRYQSTKTYGHDVGLSACFRQPNATSHCRFLHGYSLKFRFVFAADELDERNWVVDFGGLKELKSWLIKTFDHKLIVDAQDPHLNTFTNLQHQGLAELTILDGVGVELFAQLAWHKANELVETMTQGRCRCIEVECAEHGANSAVYSQTERTNK